MKKISLLLCLSLSFIFAKPIVSVSIAPQEYFVKKIAQDSVEINTLIPANTDEHNFDFNPQTIMQLEKSELYFTISLELEKILLSKFSNLNKIKLIDTQKNITLLPYEDFHHEHNHDHEEHDSLDIHTWLDPILVKTQAKTITSALSEKFPQNKAFYEQNLLAFEKELDELHTSIENKLKGIKNNKFIVYHPSWGYFAKRYELVQIPVEIEGKEPKLKDLQELISLAKKEKIKTIFVQKGFSQNASKLIAKECEASVVEIDHLSADWATELLKSAQKLEQSLK